MALWNEWSGLQRLLALKAAGIIGSGASWVWDTVSGVSPLTLPGAVSHAINRLTQSGLCVQSSTPTPSSPVDIVCNNGVIAMVDDDLPSGYTRLQSIESDGTDGYVTTGIVIDSVDTDVEVDYQYLNTSASQPKMLWGYMDGASNLPRWGFGIYASGWLGSPNNTASRGSTDTDRHTAIMSVYTRSGASYYSGTVDGDELYTETALGNVSVFEGNVLPLVLFARNNKGTAGNFANAKIFRFKVTKANVLTHDLVPCKDDLGVIGFYDLKTNTFLAASGTLTAGAVDYSHAHIDAVGTDEVLTIGEQTASVVNLLAVGAVADTQEVISGAVNRAVAVKVFDGTEAWQYSSSGYTFDWYDASIARSSVVGSQFLWCTHFKGADPAPAAQSRNGYAVLFNTSTPSNRVGFGYNDADKDVDVWKAWLAAQYANGTPVIIVYPLATPTTESVTAQHMATSVGDNVVSVVSNVDPVELEVEYAKAVST